MKLTPEDLVMLDHIEKVTYAEKRDITKGFTTAPDFSLLAVKKEKNSLYKKIDEEFYDAENRDYIKTELSKRGITTISLNQTGYPFELKKIPAPPIVLYCKGNVELLKTSKFSMVGSRRTPNQVSKSLEKISNELSGFFTLVTGLADGADTATIQGALENKKIISVIAHGYDFCYPSINSNLLNKVIENGLVISEHRPKVAPKNFLFPTRNRIIAGLGKGVLICSAGEKSGALSTAEYAKKYKKQVFALPYTIGFQYGVGCNRLIKQGDAMLVENAEDICLYYGLDYKHDYGVELTDMERKIYELVRITGEADIDTICDTLEVMSYDIITELVSLQTKKLVVKLVGTNTYKMI